MRAAIIGGGASGLAAAITAAENGADVTIYESEARVGRKILATGNGRCNLTNQGAAVKNYHGKSPSFIKGAIHRFWVAETIELFESLGVVCKTEDKGKVYPYSDQASAVLDVLRMRCEELGVEIMTEFEVKSIRKAGAEFEISAYDGRKARADKLLVATGGKAAPTLGSKGAGYALLKSMGHTISELRPSLVQLKTEPETVKKLKGIKLDARVKMGKHSAEGELLFTDYGLSGPPIFDITSQYEGQKFIEVDLMPEYDRDALRQMLYTRMCNAPDRTLENFFTGMLNKKLGMALLKDAGAAPLSRKACTLGESEIEKLIELIKAWRFRIEGTMSWNNAQTTKGGALTEEFNPVTMESLKVKGLYASGEVLDIDGDCGGYNLQWAWSSGVLAGRAMAKAN